MRERLMQLLFPPKCIFCRRILADHETDLCRTCRIEAPLCGRPNFKLSFLAGWTAVWYYRDNVRQSLLRYKFHNCRSYAQAYGRFLAMKVQQEIDPLPDLITWVPVSPLRRLHRGFDQVELLARAMGAELGTQPVQTLAKIKNTRPQSRLSDAAARRANILNAYRAVDPDRIRGKRILILDDIITTGSTISECAKTLLIAGAGEVWGAAVAVAPHDHATKK